MQLGELSQSNYIGYLPQGWASKDTYQPLKFNPQCILTHHIYLSRGYIVYSWCKLQSDSNRKCCPNSTTTKRKKTNWKMRTISTNWLWKIYKMGWKPMTKLTFLTYKWIKKDSTFSTIKSPKVHYHRFVVDRERSK